MRTHALVLCVALAMPLFGQSSGPYRITHTYTLGGDGGWDYIVPDPPNHRLFIARQNRVMVVDENTGKLLGEVTGIKGAHGTAIVADTGHGFATSGNDQSVVMFDLKTFKVLGRIPAAEDADAIIYDRAVESRLHLQRRRAFLDGDRSARRDADHEHSAGRQTGVRRVGRRRQGLRESHRHQRGGRDRRARRHAWRGAGLRRRASSPSRWRSTPRTIACSADAAAA